MIWQGDWRAIKSCAQTGVTTKPNKADKPNVFTILFKVIIFSFLIRLYFKWINRLSFQNVVLK